MKDRSVVSYYWVLGQYAPSSEQGKTILKSAKANITYKLINKDRSPTDPIIVAFKWIDTKPLPKHLVRATKIQSDKLEALK